MEEALLVLLGGLLTVAGGFYNQYYQSRLHQKRENIELLHQAEEILIEMQPHLHEVMTPPSVELDELSKRLLYIAMRIYSKNYLGLALKLVDFTKMGGYRNKDDAISLIQEVAAKSKSPLDMHHKKRNEMIRKAWEELKKLGRG